ncbi:DUF2478 domain-containing protein [Rhodovulum sp. MB263]|uniref:DUF2478 domain-containing protein n=1 Tax=Rhodovulum sp. (strain MB263) TaxID=308754 RepID=UPI0009B72BE5|nr:DUF2478 domain-containing protein [Rhodovulum sp. MB263]ARC89076.1 hypothetical protein B5V46_10875 [Rhodovulum sp. MB263]
MIPTRCLLDDADGDVAALTFAAGEAPGPLIAAFLARLRRQGRRVLRLPQSRGACPTAGAEVPDLLAITLCGGALAERHWRPALILAAAARRPVLVPVPAARFGAWLDLTGGCAVRLACHPAALDDWWRTLYPPLPPERGLTGGACALWK